MLLRSFVLSCENEAAERQTSFRQRRSTKIDFWVDKVAQLFIMGQAPLLLSMFANNRFRKNGSSRC